MIVYTVLCISHDLERQEIVVSNYSTLKAAEGHYKEYLEEDLEEYRIVDESHEDYIPLNDVIKHFTAVTVETNEAVEEVFLIKTEEV